LESEEPVAALRGAEVLLWPDPAFASCLRHLRLHDCVYADQLCKDGGGRVGLRGLPLRERSLLPNVPLRAVPLLLGHKVSRGVPQALRTKDGLHGHGCRTNHDWGFPGGPTKGQPCGGLLPCSGLGLSPHLVRGGLLQMGDRRDQEEHHTDWATCLKLDQQASEQKVEQGGAARSKLGKFERLQPQLRAKEGRVEKTLLVGCKSGVGQ